MNYLIFFYQLLKEIFLIYLEYMNRGETIINEIKRVPQVMKTILEIYIHIRSDDIF